MTRMGSSRFSTFSCLNDVLCQRHLSTWSQNMIMKPRVAGSHKLLTRQRSLLNFAKENRQVHAKQKPPMNNRVLVLYDPCCEQKSPVLNYSQLRYYSSDIKSTENILQDSHNDSNSVVSEGTKTDMIGDVKTLEQASDTDDEEDPGFKAVLSAITPNVPPPSVVEFVPGKGPPPAPPVDCCMSGCANCVWIQYAEELKNYFTVEEGNMRAKEAIEKIDNPGLQMFLKLELGLL